MYRTLCKSLLGLCSETAGDQRPGSAAAEAPGISLAKACAVQRSQLTITSHDENVLPVDKLARYLVVLQTSLHLGHVSLLVYSRTLGTQTALSSSSSMPFSPCPAQSIPSYSVAHQVAEIVLEDPDEKTHTFSASSSLPQDLAQTAEKEARHFCMSGRLRIAVCSCPKVTLACNQVNDTPCVHHGICQNRQEQVRVAM